jgi:hypothetical protein
MDLDSQDKSSASESEARQKAREILGLKPGATLPVLNLSIPDGEPDDAHAMMNFKLKIMMII